MTAVTRRWERWLYWSTCVALVVVIPACSSGGGAPVEIGPEGAAAGTEPVGVIVFDAGTAVAGELRKVELGAGEVDVVGEGAVGASARFSPDGDRLVYVRSSGAGDGSPEVRVLDLRAGTERTVGNGRCPTWTADGTGLVLSRDDGLHRVALEGDDEMLDPDQEVCGVEVGDSRYVIWAQDETLELVDMTQRRTLVEAPGCGIGPVDVDAASERIAYTVACDDGDPHRGLWVLDLESQEVSRLSDQVTYGASWSPDGGWIATTVGSRLEDEDWRYDLWVVNVADDQPRKILDGNVGQPTWGP